METRVKKWGNSASVRIPAPVLAASRLTINQLVDVREEDGRLVIEPVYENELDALIAGITPENVHEEISFGAPAGKEVF
jgi:antitoxin MazE